MAESMNIHTIIGNLTKDPERREIKRQDADPLPVCSMRVAVNRRPPRGGGEGKADYFNVEVVGPQAEACLKYLAKGRKVGVSGRHEIDEVDRRDGEGKAYFQTIRFANVQFLDSTPENGSGSAPAAQQAETDIPF